MSDKNMIALAEIRNGYALNKYGNLTLEQNSLIKYDNLCLSLIKEIQELKKQLEYLRSREYYNQLRFERDMLQYVVDNGKVSKEDKEFIDMTHRNTELLEVIEEVREYVKRNSIHFATREKVGNYFANCNCDELLQILDKVKEN